MNGARLEQWKAQARALKVETYALALAYRDPRVPWVAKVVAACVVAYALSPIDLIPDFIPVLGYLDDLLLIPLSIRLALKLIPPEVLDACRVQAREQLTSGRPTSRAGAVIVVILWGAMLLVILWAVRRVV